MHLLLSLRDSCRPIRFPNYTSPNDTFKLTHSDYWKQDARVNFGFYSKILPKCCFRSPFEFVVFLFALCAEIVWMC
jgi:hypothetical protein